ncbi:MAG: hypothetical protein H6807_03535 [Planctomycetes bacterium]|nr:hypothetical protein [Planctomycetota bacterium]
MNGTGSAGFGRAQAPLLVVLSAAALAAQLLLVRIFSYTLNHGFVYMAISLGMLGFAVGGLVIAASPRLERLRIETFLPLAAFGFALSLACGLKVFADHSRGIVPAGGLSIFRLSAWPLLMLVPPFFFAGAGIAASLVLPGRGVGGRYALNLVGSAAGCVLAQPLLEAFGAPRALALLGFLCLLAGLPAARGPYRLILGLGLLAALAGLLSDRALPDYRPDDADQYRELEREIERVGAGRPELIHAAWDPVGRIEIHRLPGAFGLIGGRAPLYYYSQDAGAGSFMIGAGQVPEAAADLARGTLYGLGANLRPDGEALVVGVGGGPDLLAILAAGQARLVGVDINAATIAALSGPFAAFLGIADDLESGRLHLEHADGRGYLRRRRQAFDLIQMTGADTYAANPAGASILSESYLYTREAFVDHLAALRPGGILEVTRFGIESRRILNTALAALEERGVERPLDHVVVVAQGPLNQWTSVLVFDRPVTAAEGARIDALCAESAAPAARCFMPAFNAIGFAFDSPLQLAYRPGLGIDRATIDRNLASPGKDLRPVVDDRPYFFQFDRLDGLPWRQVFSTGAFDRHHWGLADYLRVALQIAAVALLLLVAPLMTRRGRGVGARSLLATVLGFAGIGAGFMFLEIVLMQRCALFLGHPNLAIAVVLAMLLVASGLGSALAGRFERWPRALILVAVPGIVAWTLLFVRHAPAWFETRLDGSTVERILALALWLLPLGLLLGLPFPSALAILGRRSPRAAVWAIAVNGFASVTASLAAIPLTMIRGFSASFLVAGAAYLVALAGFLFLPRRAEGEG